MNKFKLTEEIEIHKGCNAEVVSMGEDGLSYCTECEHICEGETQFISVEEFEGLQ